MRKTNQTPSRTSPKGGRRGCLCWDENKYSRECCDGSLRAQGIGSIYRKDQKGIKMQKKTRVR